MAYGSLMAVDHLTFSARPGQVVALLGPNGAGKTSTVETLEGYRSARGGSARVLGLDPRRHHRELVSRIGVMLQEGGVYPLLGPSQMLDLFARYYPDPEDPEELLELVGLQGVARTPWRRLSGGEKHRLSLALALVGRPEVVFLDEPTAGVDPEGRMVVRSIITGLRNRGLCVILTTHELTEAERLADHVVIIDGGRKLAEGSPAALTSLVADGTIRFTSEAGIDGAELGKALGRGASVIEERPGSYRLRPPEDVTVPAVVAALTGWLAEHDLHVGDLHTGQSLEEAYLAITAAGRPAAAGGGGEAPDRPGGGGGNPGGGREGNESGNGSGRGRGHRGRRGRRRSRPGSTR